MSHDAVRRYHYRGIFGVWLTTVTVWLFSREGVAKSPCKCGSGGGIYTRGGGPNDAVQKALEADFNSRPREGGDQVSNDTAGADIISIRAPARGATLFPDHGTVGHPISIRAPARGATSEIIDYTEINQFQFAPPRGGRRASRSLSNCLAQFQFAPPRGGRPFRFQRERRHPISIRAPARGATR